MDVFSLFQAVADGGGEMRIGPNDTIRLVGDISNALKSDIRELKPQILDALWTDLRLWPNGTEYMVQDMSIYSYSDPSEDSELSRKIEEMVCLVKVLRKTNLDIDRLMPYLFAYDQACQHSHEKAVDWLRRNRGTVMDLVHDLGILDKPLEGAALIATAKEIFGGEIVEESKN